MLLLLSFAVVACESEKTPTDDGTLEVTDAAARDAGDASLVPLDAGPGLADVVAPSDACPEGELACGAAGCVDTRKNVEHCGRCNNPCDGGKCTGGSCVP